MARILFDSSSDEGCELEVLTEDNSVRFGMEQLFESMELYLGVGEVKDLINLLQEWLEEQEVA